MKWILRVLLIVLVFSGVVYAMGPTPSFKKINNKPFHRSFNINEVASYVIEKESKVNNIKPDNHSQFIWKDSLSKTEYGIVYLHGFSASHGEAYPIIDNLSDKYNCNTYLPRLYRHGLTDVDAFEDLNPELWLESAKEAIAIGKSICKNLIVVSTSTGSTFSIFLAANDPDIKALIMTSPNIDLEDSNSHLLVKPWGKQIFRMMMDGNYREWEANDTIQKYWTTKNRIEAHVALRDLLDQTMTKDIFEQINIPTFIGYYYRDETNKDNIISIDAIDKFGKTISTPKSEVKIQAFANARGHVIGSKYMNDNWKDVQDSIIDFINDVVVINK